MDAGNITKKDLLLKMQLSGEINRQTRTDEWHQAFKMYMEQTKDTSVNMECGMCYRKVKQWLEA